MGFRCGRDGDHEGNAFYHLKDLWGNATRVKRRGVIGMEWR